MCVWNRNGGSLLSQISFPGKCTLGRVSFRGACGRRSRAPWEGRAGRRGREPSREEGCVHLPRSLRWLSGVLWWPQSCPELRREHGFLLGSCLQFRPHGAASGEKTPFLPKGVCPAPQAPQQHCLLPCYLPPSPVPNHSVVHVSYHFLNFSVGLHKLHLPNTSRDSETAKPSANGHQKALWGMQHPRGPEAQGPWTQGLPGIRGGSHRLAPI